MKFETRYLSGKALTWAFAHVQGYQPVYTDPAKAAGPMFRRAEAVVEFDQLDFRASMIDVLARERIWVKERFSSVWDAYQGIQWEPKFKGVLVVTGTSLIEAAQRLCVYRMFGPVIEIPDAILSKLGLTPAPVQEPDHVH